MSYTGTMILKRCCPEILAYFLIKLIDLSHKLSFIQPSILIHISPRDTVYIYIETHTHTHTHTHTYTHTHTHTHTRTHIHTHTLTHTPRIPLTEYGSVSLIQVEEMSL